MADEAVRARLDAAIDVRGGTLTADTKIIKRERSVVFLESRVANGAGEIVAAASGSFAVIRRGEG